MLIFDFDGVLINSLNEVVVTAYNSVSGQQIIDLEAVPETLTALFKRNRFHFQAAGDAVVLMQWCLETYRTEPEKILSPAEYQDLLQANDVPLLDRTNRFFETRGRLIKKDREKWLSLNTPFQPLWNALIERGGERVVILTNKNREAVLNLCRHFRLGILGENIYSGDHGATKIENLNSILGRFKASRYFFIDDSIKNLRQIDTAFNSPQKIFSLLFASWGYNGPEDPALARNYGYQIVNQQDTIEMLDAELLPRATV